MFSSVSTIAYRGANLDCLSPNSIESPTDSFASESWKHPGIIAVTNGSLVFATKRRVFKFCASPDEFLNEVSAGLACSPSKYVSSPIGWSEQASCIAYDRATVNLDCFIRGIGSPTSPRKPTILSYNQKIAMFRDLAKGLAEIHQRGMVHRDIKPENLLVTETSDGPRVKYADFGYACELGSGDTSRICGTPGYISPEILEYMREIQSGRVVDVIDWMANDVWCLGCVFYTVFTGNQLPWIVSRSFPRCFSSIRWDFHDLRAENLVDSMMCDKRYRNSASDVVALMDELWPMSTN